VSDAALELLYAEIDGLSRYATFTILPFDYTVDEKNMVVWHRGSHLKAQRTRCGGTCFDAPTQYFNEHGEYDGLLILTDGEAPSPVACRSRRAWLLPPGCKMNFPTDDIVMYMEASAVTKREAA
jgi:predicted metal-dependent peptidase